MQGDDDEVEEEGKSREKGKVICRFDWSQHVNMLTFCFGQLRKLKRVERNVSNTDPDSHYHESSEEPESLPN